MTEVAVGKEGGVKRPNWRSENKRKETTEVAVKETMTGLAV